MYKLSLKHRYSEVTDYVDFARQFQKLIYAKFPHVRRIDFNSADRSSSIYFLITTNLTVQDPVWEEPIEMVLKIRFSDHQEAYECDYSVDDDSSRTIQDAVNFIDQKINEAKNV